MRLDMTWQLHPFMLLPCLMMQMMWAWQNLFDNIFNEHAPRKQVKIRNKSAPWISDEMRYKMNRRYKMLKKAINTKCPLLWKNGKERGMRSFLP